MTELSLRVKSTWLIAFPCFKMIRAHLWISALIELFDGLTISFPLNFRNVHPRKSKPSSICVMSVFSSDRVRPRILRNWLTKSLSSSANSFVFAVSMKSSAYRTRLTFVLARWWFSMVPFEFRCYLSWINCSSPSSVMFAYRLDMAPPCGEPVFVGNRLPW